MPGGAVNERQNRTIICSVLFLDLVEYSRKPVAEQMTLKERFNLLLREALKGVAPNDRIVLDTGDGAAVTFLGDPEDALFMALSLRDAMHAESETQGLRLRSGINLGPVKLVKDVNGRPNIIGDGINVAQRIMGFAAPGQVLVSRSYYEVVSRLSDDYVRLFSYEGSRTDKHVREHEVYGLSGEHPIPQRPPGASQSGHFPTLLQGWFDHLHAKPRAATVLLAGVILLLGGIVRAHREAPPAALAERPAIAVKTVLSLPTAVYEVPVSGPGLVPAPAPVSEPANAAAAREEKPLANPSGQQTPAAPKKVAAAKRSPASGSQVPAADPLVAVSLAVLPWGEIYVDGKPHGVTPPIRSLHLAPGRHEIEFRNTTFPSHIEVVEVKPGEKVTLRHKFQEAAK